MMRRQQQKRPTVMRQVGIATRCAAGSRALVGQAWRLQEQLGHQTCTKTHRAARSAWQPARPCYLLCRLQSIGLSKHALAPFQVSPLNLPFCRVSSGGAAAPAAAPRGAAHTHAAAAQGAGAAHQGATALQGRLCSAVGVRGHVILVSRGWANSFPFPSVDAD